MADGLSDISGSNPLFPFIPPDPQNRHKHGPFFYIRFMASYVNHSSSALSLANTDPSTVYSDVDWLTIGRRTKTGTVNFHARVRRVMSTQLLAKKSAYLRLRSFLSALAFSKNYRNCLVAQELSRLTGYYDKTYFLPSAHSNSYPLFGLIDCQDKEIVQSIASLPNQSATEGRNAVILEGHFNCSLDIQGLLDEIRPKLSRYSRLLVVGHSPYFRCFKQLARMFFSRTDERGGTFLTRNDLQTLCRLSGFECVKIRPLVHSPKKLFGIGALWNAIGPTIPLLRWISFSSVAVLRPIIPSNFRPSLSVVIPARNERGNIESAISRLSCADLEKTEIIFVEGHSLDGTWNEIQRVIKKYKSTIDIKAFRQSGNGKADAVRTGFSHATGDLLTILDADLTMPPEMLSRFVDAFCRGHGDFVNGSRLLYPMEGRAMRYLNKLGNVFFAKLLSYVLDNPLTDSLCGTKLFLRSDYERMKCWREKFGDFDPFGDFELIFPAVELGLGIIEVPIRYRDRVYGTTQIHRFRHGLRLLKMTAIGYWKLRLGRR